MELKDILARQFPDVALQEGNNNLTMTIDKDDLLSTCKWLRDNNQCYFDMLSCISGIDDGVDTNTMRVIYQLHSIPFERSLTLEVQLTRTAPQVDSVNAIWKSANWMERETYDMLGIIFNHHPDLRRLLLPADWDGFPLRKDYEQADEYHGVSIEYDRDDQPSK
ncbi:MAG: NADH-quinone oxidoreductase subunit C [Cyclobacteriaceae bacterium]